MPRALAQRAARPRGAAIGEARRWPAHGRHGRFPQRAAGLGVGSACPAPADPGAALDPGRQPTKLPA